MIDGKRPSPHNLAHDDGCAHVALLLVVPPPGAAARPGLTNRQDIDGPGRTPGLLLFLPKEERTMEGLRIQPEREEFDALAREWPLVPAWAELSADVSTPVGVFPSLAGDGPGALLATVERSEPRGR